MVLAACLRSKVAWLIVGSTVVVIGVSLSYESLLVLWRSWRRRAAPRIIEIEDLTVTEEMVQGKYRMLARKSYPGFTFELLPKGVYHAHIDDPSYKGLYLDWSGRWQLLKGNSNGKVISVVMVTQWPVSAKWYGIEDHANRWCMNIKSSDLTRITPNQRIWAVDPHIPPFSLSR